MEATNLKFRVEGLGVWDLQFRDLRFRVPGLGT